MAIDLMAESISSSVSSPRIIISNDHNKKAGEEISEDDQFIADSDFDFCISITESETSSADELFSDGLILPLKLQQKFVLPKSLSLPKPQSQPPLPLLPPPISKKTSKQEPTKELITSANDIETEPKNQSKPFWRISRSSSVHSDKKTSFWSLPILPRSNSTGSRQSSNLKQPKKLTGSLSQKPPLRKNYGGLQHPNGVRISPVLHVPHSNLFGFGTLFNKEKKSKK